MKFEVTGIGGLQPDYATFFLANFEELDEATVLPANEDSSAFTVIQATNKATFKDRYGL